MNIYKQELAYQLFHSIQTDDRYGRERHEKETIDKLSNLDTVILESVLKIVNEVAYNVVVLGHEKPKTLRDCAIESYTRLMED